MQVIKRLIPDLDQLRRQRWLRWLGPRVLDAALWTPRRRPVARGAAIGLFFAFIVPFSQAPVAVAASVLLRANVPAAVAGTFVTTPLTWAPIAYAAHEIGRRLLPAQPDAAPAAADDAPTGGWLAHARAARDFALGAGKPLALGLLTLGVVCSLLGWLLVRAIWAWRVLARRRARRR